MTNRFFWALIFSPVGGFSAQNYPDNSLLQLSPALYTAPYAAPACSLLNAAKRLAAQCRVTV
jgi:hypothetical protein